MKTIFGNLIELTKNGKFDVIVHGCNCFNSMQTGFAKKIKDNFPRAYEADSQTKRGDPSKLGTFTMSPILHSHHQFVVVNAYTQLGTLSDGPQIDVEAIRKVFRAIRHKFDGLRIAYPIIPGGEWYEIAEIIDESLSGQRHTLVIDENNQYERNCVTQQAHKHTHHIRI